VILLVGLGASALLAAQWRASVQSANRKAFQSTTAGLNSRLGSSLQANIDLTRTLRAVATMEPGADETRFRDWYGAIQVGGVADAAVAATLIERVPAADLAGFRRAVESDAAFRSLVGGRFQIDPAGSRAVYCLTRAFVGTTFARGAYPVLLDYCAPVLPVVGRSPFPALMNTAIDSGAAVVVPVGGTGGSPLAASAVAVYRAGAPVATVAERRAAVSGFIATTFNPTVLLGSLLIGHSSVSIELYHSNDGAAPVLIASAGPMIRTSAFHARSSLGSGWVVAEAGTYGVSAADTQELVVLGWGAVITLSILLVYLVLLRSRSRAWGLLAKKTDELAYVAMHDPLTGLPNRSLVLDRAQQLLARGRRLETPVTALYLDIDGFKQINDAVGHRLADEVLRQTAGRLQGVMREGDTVGRLGADQFVMLIDPLDGGGAELVAERVQEVLARPVELPEPARSAISITVSVGIATGLPDSAEDLLRDADLALRDAKAKGRGTHAVFESAMGDEVQDRTELEMSLAQALAGEQFWLVYQPIVELDTQRVSGVEALLRWRHPVRGDTTPDVFIPIAEQSGLIVPIGRWVLEQACAQCTAWHQKGHLLGVSVNVSARQFERADFVQQVRDVLTASGLDAAWLTLEITETALMSQPAATEAMLVELKALGVHIAVDDFGTGYSSLGYLRQFPIDSLKLDRSFITGLARSAEANALAHTLIQLGKTLGLRTVAEGVEAYTQLAQLQLEGCDYAQGYLFARPLPPEALEEYLEGSGGSRTAERQASVAQR
jgi:diguanylate cyclase (GGDEF)-like protein